MNRIIDLTKHNFDRIDFTESEIIDFHCKYELPNSLEFTIWGATLLLEPRWNHVEKFESSLPSDTDMYVAGIGVIKMNNLVGGQIEVYIYDKVNQLGITNVAKYEDGSKLLLRREWPFVKTMNTDEYLWECVMQWPYGFCNLRLFSDNGQVTFQFDSDDIVPADAFIMNPQMYGLKNRNIK